MGILRIPNTNPADRIPVQPVPPAVQQPTPDLPPALQLEAEAAVIRAKANKQLTRRR